MSWPPPARPPSSTGFDQSLTRIAVGDAPAGWHAYSKLLDHPAEFTPDGPTQADDPMLLYFTSGTTAKPKLVLHSASQLPGGPSHHDLRAGAAAGRRASQHLLAGLGQACVELLLRAVDRGRHDLHRQPAALQCALPARCRRRQQGDDALRAADRVAHADPGRPEVVQDLAARGAGGRRAAEPGGDRAGREGLGPHHPRLLRPDRDHDAGRQSAGPADQARLDGPSPARLQDPPARRRREGRRGRRDLHRPRGPPGRADAGLPAGRRLDRAAHRRGLPHRRRRLARRRRLPHLRRPRRRRVQGVGLPDQPLRAGKRADRASRRRRGRRRARARRRCAWPCRRPT